MFPQQGDLGIYCAAKISSVIKTQSKRLKLLSENIASFRKSFKGEPDAKHLPFRDWFLALKDKSQCCQHKEIPSVVTNLGCQLDSHFLGYPKRQSSLKKFLDWVN